MNMAMQGLLRLVNAGNATIAVTLLAGGKRITGMLVPNDHWESFFMETVGRAVSSSGGTTTLGNPASLLRGKDMTDEEKDELVNRTYSTVILREATIHDVTEGERRAYPYLAIAAAAVAAVTLGIHDYDPQVAPDLQEEPSPE